MFLDVQHHSVASFANFLRIPTTSSCAPVKAAVTADGAFIHEKDLTRKFPALLIQIICLIKYFPHINK